MNTLECKAKDDWTKWLEENFDKEKEIWLVFYKKNSTEFIMDYEFAVEESLCYGWIDSLIKKIDDQKYCRKFTVRKEKSNWSDLNKKRVEKLLKEKRMKKSGLRLVEYAKRNGLWDKNDKPQISLTESEEFISELTKNKAAKTYYDNLSLTDKKLFLLWINSAKKEETKNKRINESILVLSKKEKLGLK